MTGPRFVGVSTGRAGSVYTATVMRLAGIPTLHEDCFNGDNLQSGVPVWGNRDEYGEWSAQAVPFLHMFPDVTVWHQVRHPLATVGSLMKRRLFERPEAYGAQGKVITDRFDVDTSDPLRTTVRFYLDWNLRCEQAAVRRWQVEELDADLIVDLGADVGIQVDRQVADTVIATTSRKLNSGGGSPATWDGLAHLPEYDKLRDMAGRYGYA